MVGGNGRTVVVADDDPALRMLCRINLELEGEEVLEAESGAALAAAIDEHEVALVLLDIHLGSDDGTAIARELRQTHPEVSIVFFSGSAALRDLSMELADGVLPKPFTLEELSATVRRLVPA